MDWAQLTDPSAWEFWLGIGLVFAILEVLDGSFFLLSLGLGFMGTAIPAALGLDSVTALLGICAVLQLIIFALVRPIGLRAMETDATPTNVDALIGQRCVISKRIGGENESGYVRIQGEEWRALTKGTTPLEEGTSVVINSVSGASVYVEPTND